MADFDYNLDYHAVLSDDKRWLDCLAHATGQVEIQTYSIMSVSPNWHMLPRCFSQHVFYYLLDQEVLGTINGQAVYLKPNSLMWIAPNVPHELWLKENDKPFTMYNLRFKYWQGQECLRFTADYMLRHHAQDHLRLIDILFDELFKSQPQKNIRLQHLIDLLYADLTQEQTESTLGMLSRRTQNKLFRYVQQHCKQRPSIGDLAQVAQLSVDYFRRQFQKTFHMAPREWIVEQRIRHSAQALIESPRRLIGDIALDFGYEDIYLYSRQFKQVLGLSPSHYRQQH